MSTISNSLTCTFEWYFPISDRNRAGTLSRLRTVSDEVVDSLEGSDCSVAPACCSINGLSLRGTLVTLVGKVLGLPPQIWFVM